MTLFSLSNIRVKALCSLLLMLSFSVGVAAQQYGNPYIKQRLNDQQRAVKSTPAQKNYHLRSSVPSHTDYQTRHHRQQVEDYYRWLAERDYYDRIYRDHYDNHYGNRRHDRTCRHDRRYDDRYPYSNDSYYRYREPRGASVNISIHIPLEETVRRHYHTSTYINTNISTDRSRSWFVYSTRGLPLMDSFSDRQRRIHYQSLERAVNADKIGQTIAWDSRFASGSVVAVKEGVNRDGDYCREFKQVVSHKKQREKTFTTACKRQNGHWKIVAQQ